MVSGVESPADRVFRVGSRGAGCFGAGVQIIRCHDVAEHRQAFDLWEAVNYEL